MDGWSVLDSWAGRTRTRIRIVGETPTRYRIEALTRMKLAGRDRCAGSGAHTLVPKSAVVITPRRRRDI